MIEKTELTQSRLMEILRYDSGAGMFTRINSVGNMKTGGKAGGIDNCGYIRITINGQRYQAHHLAWLYHYGVIPKVQIDHRDGIRANNRIENLRECHQLKNCRNKNMQSNNTSGVTGVKLQERKGKTKITRYWVAQWYTVVDKLEAKVFSIDVFGYEKAFEMAVAYRLEKIQELNAIGYGYTDRHGLTPVANLKSAGEATEQQMKSGGLAND